MAITPFIPPRADGAAPEPAPAAPAGEPALRWDERLGLGVPEIDEQHRGLVGFCNELVEAVRQGRGPEAVGRTMTRLREYTAIHFAAEERYMERVGYPDLGRHRTAHAALVRRVKDYQRQIYQRQPPTPAEVRAFLKGWLIDHILGEDLKIAAFLKTRASERKKDTEPPSEPSGE